MERKSPRRRRRPQRGFGSSLLSISSPLTADACLPGTSPSERPKVTLGCSCMGRRLPIQQTGQSEGMPWAHVVLSWMPHQIPRAGERCSPVYRQSPSASSGVLRLPRTFTHPDTDTPARRGRCTADMGARGCESAPPVGRGTVLQCWSCCRGWHRDRQCRRGWCHGRQHGQDIRQDLRQWPRLRGADRTGRPGVTAHRPVTGQRGDGGGKYNKRPGGSAGA